VALNNGSAAVELDVTLPIAGAAEASSVLRALPLPGDAAADDVPVRDGRASIGIPPRSGRVLALRGS